MFNILTKVDKSAETRRTLHTHTHTHTHTCNLLLSPKQIGTICFAIFSFVFFAPSFADPDIGPYASTADCKHNPLQTYSGTSNLQANWQANEIYLDWYDGDELLDVPAESWLCVYDGTLTPPPAPTKTGYTFKGWRVKRMANISRFNLDETINGTNYGYIGVDGGAGVNAATYGLTSGTDDVGNYGEWAVTFSYGIVKGKASCRASKYSGTPGSYCVCILTNFTPVGEEVYDVSRSYTSAGIDSYSSQNDCENSCAQGCAVAVQTDTGTRQSLFTPK